MTTIPPLALTRYAKLRQRLTVAQAASRDLGEEIEALQRAADKQRSALTFHARNSQVEVDDDGRCFETWMEQGPALPGKVGRPMVKKRKQLNLRGNEYVEALRAVERAVSDRAALNAEPQQLQPVVNSCLQVLRDRGWTGRSRPLDALAEVQGSLARLAAERVAMVEERDIVRSAPRPLDVVRRDIGTSVARLAETISLGGGYLLHEGANLSAIASDLNRELTASHGAGMLALMAALYPEKLASRLVTEATAAYQNLPSPLSGSAKAERLGEIDQQIANVDRQAAALFWQAEAVGINLPVPEISAEVLLGLDAEAEP